MAREGESITRLHFSRFVFFFNEKKVFSPLHLLKGIRALFTTTAKWTLVVVVSCSCIEEEA